MDQAHPITKFLLSFGYWIRGLAISLILCLMLKTGFLSFGEAQAGANLNTLYLALFLFGLFGPSVGQWAFAPFWEKITPIKDRVTYVEDEIVFAGSALIGISAALIFWAAFPLSKALLISTLAILAATPLFFLIWATKSVLTPLKYVDTSENLAAAQIFRDETPYFWRNILAYLITAAVSAFVLTQALIIIIHLRGGEFRFEAEWASFFGFTVVNLIAAPIFIWLGRKMKPRDKEPKGYHYSLGAITFLTAIVALNTPVIFKSSFQSGEMLDVQALVEAWPFGVAYTLMISSYIAGGFVFSKLYKPRPPALEFG